MAPPHQEHPPAKHRVAKQPQLHQQNPPPPIFVTTRILMTIFVFENNNRSLAYITKAKSGKRVTNNHILLDNSAFLLFPFSQMLLK
jgi:hypothetical protein